MTHRAEQIRRTLSNQEAMADAEGRCVPCKLCGGKALITDAGTGWGYYIRCENSLKPKSSDACMVDEVRLSGWAFNVMNMWNRQHANPSPSTHVPPILKGVGKINGDGWKDSTRKGEIVFVWNREHPEPYAAGQFPRVGREHWSASTEQFDFFPATLAEIEALFSPPAPVPNVTGWQAMATAPLDKTPVIIAVPTEHRDDWIVGEAYHDPEHYEGGDWWWAGTRHDGYDAGPISDCNHHAPEYWQPMPPIPPTNSALTSPEPRETGL